MKFSVNWKPSSEAALAGIWASAQGREAITVAANSIDDQLAVNPASRGESRGGSTRILVVSPVAVTYEIRNKDRVVTVLAVDIAARVREESDCNNAGRRRPVRQSTARADHNPRQ